MSIVSVIGLLLAAWVVLLLIPVCVLFVQILCAWPALRPGALRTISRKALKSAAAMFLGFTTTTCGTLASSVSGTKSFSRS